MTFQTAVHSQSTLGPPTFPPLLLSSSKGFKDKRGKELVSVGAVGGWVMHWSVDCLERDDTLIVPPTPQTYSHIRTVPPTLLKFIAVTGIHRWTSAWTNGGLAVERKKFAF